MKCFAASGHDHGLAVAVGTPAPSVGAGKRGGWRSEPSSGALDQTVGLNRRSAVRGDVHDLLTSISRRSGPHPAGGAEALDRARAIYRTAPVSVDIEAVLLDAREPARRESGFQLVGLSEPPCTPPPGARESRFPCLSKLETPGGDFTICVANREARRWEILPGIIERGIVDHLLQAEGVPAFGHQIPELRDHAHRMMSIIWKINEAAAVGIGAGNDLVESTFSSRRRSGARSDPLNDRVFFIRAHRWSIHTTIRVPRLDRVTDLLTEHFGAPPKM
jgi:hypothetical protein